MRSKFIRSVQGEGHTLNCKIDSEVETQHFGTLRSVAEAGLESSKNPTLLMDPLFRPTESLQTRFWEAGLNKRMIQESMIEDVIREQMVHDTIPDSAISK